MQNRNPIAKAFRAYVWLVEQPSADVGVREMAEALHVSPSSAHRILNALEEVGFVQHDGDNGRYRLSLEPFRLANILTKRTTVADVARPDLKELMERCNETTLLGLYDSQHKEMVFAEIVETTHPVKYFSPRNQRIPVHAGASGLAIMAYLPESEIEAIIEKVGLTRLTPDTITDRARMMKELARVREKGYALTIGQRTPGAVGIAAPIFDSSGNVIGDVLLTIPQQRFNPSDEARLSAMVVECAASITRKVDGSFSRGRVRK
jgi:IclR family transcriptional regulator, acetate operon repressor